MIKNILVTGADGFIGTNLVNRLKIENYNIVDFSNRYDDISNCNMEYEEIHHVIHLAGKTFVPKSWEEPFEFYRVNVMGTANVLEFCRKNSCSLTFLSSYVYGVPEKLPISEEHPLNPNTPYNHSKVLAENLCGFYSEKFNIPITVLRPFNIYGYLQREDFLIPSIIKQAVNKNKEQIEVMDLKPKRDYLYIEDLIDVILLTIENSKFSVYNVGSGYSVSVEEIINIILEVTGIHKIYTSKNIQRKDEVTDVVADISKIKRELGWTPSYTIYEGIRHLIELTDGRCVK